MAGVTTIADRIQSDLAAFLKQPKGKIELRHSLRKDLGLNSVDTIELIFLLEEKFNFEFSDADVQQLITVSDVIACVEHRVTSRA
jgi:acyl carrier protein